MVTANETEAISDVVQRAHEDAARRIAEQRKHVDPGGRPRGTNGVVERVAPKSLEELKAASKELAVSQEQIDRFERHRREAQDAELRERFGAAAQEARKLFPLRRSHQDAVIRHCDPWRTAPVLERCEALKAVARWDQPVNDGRNILALIGDMGQGKTTAAMVRGVRALMAGRSVLYVKEATLLRWRKFVSQSALYERAVGTGLLVIDELGGEKGNGDQARAAILEIVDDRLAVGDTMLLGNLTRTEFGDRYDERLLDRMRECGIIVECLGDSMRGAPTRAA